MDRNSKELFVSDFKNKLEGAEVILVAHYAGLSVASMNSLRGEAKRNNVSIQVAKNSLAKLALDGTAFENLKDNLSGPTVFLFSGDVVSASKILVKFAKEYESLLVKVGSYNSDVIDEGEIVNISKMPSLDEIRAKLISLIQTPAQKIACVLQAPASQTARVIKAYSEK